MYKFSRCEEKLKYLYDDIFEVECESCAKCRNEVTNLSRPLSAWMVGHDFEEQDVRLLFVGKTARGYFENLDCKYNNVFEHGRELYKEGWSYWNYTKEIAIKKFGNDWLEKIAVTNIVKCNNSDSIDRTSDSMKNYCIKELGILRKEIAVINPTHVIFYTGWTYDGFIEYAFDKIIKSGNWRETKLIGNYNSPWCEGVSKVSNRDIFFLRTCHPERKKKEDFINSVFDWICRTGSCK